MPSSDGSPQPVPRRRTGARHLDRRV